MEKNTPTNAFGPHRPSISTQSAIVVGMRSLSVPVQADKSASPRPSDSILEVGKKAAKAIKKTAKFAGNIENNTNVVKQRPVPPLSTKNFEEMRSKRVTLAVSSPKKEIKTKLTRSKSLSDGFKNSWDYSLNFVDPEEANEDEALRILQESIQLLEAEKKDFEKIKNAIIVRAKEEDSPRSTPDLKKENGNILGVSKERLVKLITSPLNTIGKPDLLQICFLIDVTVTKLTICFDSARRIPPIFIDL